MMDVSVTITKEEFDFIKSYSNKIMTMLTSCICYKGDILAFDRLLQTEMEQWNDIVNRHFNDNNYNNMSLLMFQLMAVKRSKQYKDPTQTEVIFNISRTHWKSLKAIVYDITDFANILIVKLSDHKKSYDLAISVIRNTLEYTSKQYAIKSPDYIHDKDFMNDATWLSVYDLCKDIHDDYIKFAETIGAINKKCFTEECIPSSKA
jgi:hypothetical protein